MNDNIKVTFDDLIKRKYEKDKIIKKQIEANKKNLLERFFNKANTLSPTSTAPNSTIPSNSNNFDSANPNEKESILPTIYEYSITETSKFEYDETKAVSNDNNTNSNLNYLQMREKYKNERNKKKSSIFKSEDLRISQTESLNLKQSDNNSNAIGNEDNLYSPINENNILQNQENIFLIQKKLFENESNAYIESQDIFDINNICIKDDDKEKSEIMLQSNIDDNVNVNINMYVDYSIQKQFDFCLKGIDKKNKKIITTHSNVSSAGNVNRNKRILSMQLVAKIDYSVHTKQNSINNNNSNISNINNSSNNKIIIDNKKQITNRYKPNINMTNITKQHQQQMQNTTQQRTRSTSKQQRKKLDINSFNSPNNHSLSGKSSLLNSLGIFINNNNNNTLQKRSAYKVFPLKHQNNLNTKNKPQPKSSKPSTSLNKKKPKCSF